MFAMSSAAVAHLNLICAAEASIRPRGAAQAAGAGKH